MFPTAESWMYVQSLVGSWKLEQLNGEGHWHSKSGREGADRGSDLCIAGMEQRSDGSKTGGGAAASGYKVHQQS